jgi:pentatricopeptide repeat protein
MTSTRMIFTSAIPHNRSSSSKSSFFKARFRRRRGVIKTSVNANDDGRDNSSSLHRAMDKMEIKDKDEERAAIVHNKREESSSLNNNTRSNEKETVSLRRKKTTQVKSPSGEKKKTKSNFAEAAGTTKRRSLKANTNAHKKRLMAEKYRREHHQNHRKNTNTHSTNTKNEKEGVHRNAELDSMRPGERIVKAMENISAFDKYRYYYGGGKKKDEDDEDEDEMTSSSEYEPINFDLVEVDSTEVERLYKSLERDPAELSADDEFKDLLMEVDASSSSSSSSFEDGGTDDEENNNNNKNNNNKEEDFERRSGENSSSGNNRGSSNSLSGGQQRRRYNNNVIGNHNTTTTRTTNADVFHLKDVARAVINPSSSLAQHNLDEMKNSKIEKDPNHKFGTSTINFAIKELGERNDFSRAYALYRWMSTQAFNDESKYSPNAYTFCALASSAKTSREVRIVLEVWRGELKIAKHMLNNNKNTSKATGGKDVDFDSTQSWLARNECASAAIAMTTKIGDWQSALEIFNDVKKIGNVKRNIYTYTAILTALRDSGKADEAEQILYEMLEERNVRVTSLAFSLALGAFEVARMWQEGNKLAKSAFKVFQIDSPDATLTHAIITMAGRAGDLQFASETFENMKNSTLVVTTYSYNALLGGYARYGDWESAHRVFSDLRQAHLQPDRYTYTQLISAAERAGEYEAADVVWREMLTKSRHVVPHTVMCGAYIHCLARQRRNLEAEDVLETMKARWDVPRNAAVYNALIGAHVRAGDVPKALHVYDRMQKEDNIMATEITFAVLIRACEEDGEFVKMADLLQQAKELLAREGKLVMDLTGGGGRGGSNGLF